MCVRDYHCHCHYPSYHARKIPENSPRKAAACSSSTTAKVTERNEKDFKEAPSSIMSPSTAAADDDDDDDAADAKWPKCGWSAARKALATTRTSFLKTPQPKEPRTRCRSPRAAAAWTTTAQRSSNAAVISSSPTPFLRASPAFGAGHVRNDGAIGAAARGAAAADPVAAAAAAAAAAAPSASTAAASSAARTSARRVPSLSRKRGTAGEWATTVW